MARSPNNYPIVILIMRIVSAILLALSILAMVTDRIKIDGEKTTFTFVYAFRYFVVGSAIGLLYNVLQIGLAIYLNVTRKLMLSYPFELYFDILADEVIGFFMASSASAAFAVASELKTDYDKYYEISEGLTKVNYYFEKAELSAVLALIATLPIIVTSMLSAYFLYKS